MVFIADLHIHSRFSRATSKSLDFIALHRAALEKGIQLVGTGDFTHPGWMAEIEAQLEPAEEGVFKLKPALQQAAEQGLPKACAGQVRFILQVEISNIYKKEEKTRKNHNLVFAPSLEAARNITEKLDAIGNIASDGRPILGLDAQDLLEITLESHPLSFLIPAHIWTPWFSMFGSKSGFDSMKECFGPLEEHIFAAETGLSSDPLMNWRVSELDRVTLISNSDAHSAHNLGREANLFDTEINYPSLLEALKTRNGFLGTIEFFPEEGKYHLDGHRKCDVRLQPEETRELDGICPVCNGRLTVGVMSRVQDLADRDEGEKPKQAAPFESLVPLAEVVGEVLGVGPKTKKVRALLDSLLLQLGPELTVLRDVPLEEIEQVGGAPLREGIRRVRTGEMSIAPGFDGEFGSVKIFEPGERDHLLGQMAFLGPPKKAKAKSKPKPQGSPKKGRKKKVADNKSKSFVPVLPDDPLLGLNDDQKEAAQTQKGPLLIVAGPGTGKTRTLVARIAHQVKTRAVRPEAVLAISFTNQAALELEERILEAVPGAKKDAPRVMTFHGLGLWLLKELSGRKKIDIVDDDRRLGLVMEVIGPNAKKREAEALLSRISLAKQSREPLLVLAGDEAFVESFKRYEKLLSEQDAFDVDDLVLRSFQLLVGDTMAASRLAGRFSSVSVDEYQDVNDVQAALIKLLSPSGKTLLAIGDPAQAIYGFRGARPLHFKQFNEVFKDAKTISLKTSYRLTEQVLNVARSIIGDGGNGMRANKSGPKVEVVACPTPASEAEQIVVRLEQILGGTSTFAIDSGRGGEAEEDDIGFGDVAVLCRIKAQRKEIVEALGRSGIPCLSVGEDEPHDSRSQKVAVMTMHASKGREFDVVFVTGIEPGLLPLCLEGLTSTPDEERRLLYVAVTRARRLAVLSHAARRTLFGKTMPGGPSPFLADLPNAAIERKSPCLPRKKSTQLSLF